MDLRAYYSRSTISGWIGTGRHPANKITWGFKEKKDDFKENKKNVKRVVCF